MKKLLFILFAFHFSLFTLKAQGTWTQRASLPDSVRGYGIGFSIGNYGYVGLGASSKKGIYSYYRDFWQFDPSINSWTRKADFPGMTRVCPATFVIGHKAFIVTGQDSTKHYGTECWEYDADVNTWTQKTGFPGTARAYAVGFAIGGKGYVGTGYNSNILYNRDFWQYDTTTDTWASIADIAGPPRFSASGFAVNGKGYVCFGRDSITSTTNDMWAYDTGTNAWTQKSSCPGPTECCENGFVIKNNIHIGCGTNDKGKDYNQFWQYNTTTDTWANESYFPGSDTRAVTSAFAIQDTGYLGLGVDSNVAIYFNDLYAFHPDSTLGVETIISNNKISVYPIPFTTYCNIYFNNNEDNRSAIITLCDMERRIVSPIIKNENNHFLVYRNNLPEGIYILSIQCNNQIFHKKLIITN